MKILLLTTYPIHEKEIELQYCKSQYHIFLYFLKQYLKSHEVIIKHIPEMGNSSRVKNIYQDISFPNADHCIVVENRGVQRRPDIFFENLRKSISGCISTISASSSIKGNEDVLFYMIPAGKRKRKNARFIGWACDKNLIQPMHYSGIINILIDHPYYGREDSRMANVDQTLNISDIVYKWGKDKKNVNINRFCRGGIEVVDDTNFNKLEKYVQNDGLNYYEACKIYSSTDVFFVTHPECMGLVVLECAMAGALIVTPEGFIKKELLKYVNHVIIEKDFDMDELVSKIDHKLSRKMVERFNWANVTQRILNTFEYFEKYKENDLWFTRPIRI